MKNIVKFVIPFILVIAIPIILFLQKSDNEIQKIDRIAKMVYDEFHPTGYSIAIIKDNEIIYENAFGYRSAENMTMLNNNDIFNIVSCTKAFTAAAIGKLVQEGLLSWDEKVIDYLPDFKLSNEYITQNLTIKDILSHRTGLATFQGDLLWYNSDYSNKEVIERMQYLPILNDFRSDFGYQNNMYIIAGEIIETITGQSWERFIQQNFLDPLEMSDSRTSSDKFNGTEDIAFPHLNDSTLAVNYYLAGKPAVSIWSNTRDLSNWVKMLLNNGKWKNEQVLNPETIDMLTKAHTIVPVSKSDQDIGIHFKNYALGWYTFDYNGLKVINHDGSIPGYICNIAFIPEQDLAVIVLNNGFNYFSNDAVLFSVLDVFTDTYKKDWVDYFLLQQMEYDQYINNIEAKRIKQKIENTEPTTELNNFIGIYTDKIYGDAEIKMENNKLKLTLLPSKKVFSGTLNHWDNNNFKVQFKDSFLPFAIIRFDVNNKVKGFKIDLPSADFHFNNLDFKKIN